MKTQLLFLTLIASTLSCGSEKNSTKDDSTVKSGMTIEHISCTSTKSSVQESFSLRTHSRSAPGGPVTSWTEFNYGGPQGSTTFTMGEGYMVRSFSGSGNLPKMIYTGALSNETTGSSGHLHIHADASSKKVFLDARIDLMLSCTTVGCNTILDTKGLRQLSGFECKVNGTTFKI